MTTEEKFLAAVNVIDSLPRNGPFQPSEEVMMKFKSYYKQATKGPCNADRPSIFDYRRDEWYAWKKLGEMSKESAMKMYIDQLSKVIETMSYTEAVSRFIDLMGPFYEIVWPDDALEDTAEDRDESQVSNNGDSIPSPEESTNFGLSQQDAASEESFEMFSSQPSNSESFVNVERLDLAAADNAKADSPDSLDNDQARALSDNLVHLSKALPLSARERYSNEILYASVQNLQKSLDDIMQRLCSLESIAKTYRSQVLTTMKDNDPKGSWWSLNRFTLALIIFWPFVVHWLVHVTRQQRRSA